MYVFVHFGLFIHTHVSCLLLGRLQIIVLYICYIFVFCQFVVVDAVRFFDLLDETAFGVLFHFVVATGKFLYLSVFLGCCFRMLNLKWLHREKSLVYVSLDLFFK